MFGKNKKSNNYKFKSLRTYSWNKVVSNKKKFRKLFDRWELSYLSAELIFYNKLFDEENWSTEIVLKAFSVENGEQRKMLCEHKKEVDVDKSQNVIIIDYGWGSDDKGSFWEKGQYVWEAYVEGELVGTTKFYIEDHGEVTEKNNPYLTVISLRTYEAPQGDLDIDQRVYYKKFDKSKTRYIMGELRFSSKLSEEWLSEFFFNVYDDTGQLIGSGDVMSLVTPEDKEPEVFTVTSGWGSEKPDLWIDDYFTMEVIFMDTVVGVIPFSVGDTFVERLSDYEALLNEEVLSRFEPGLAGATIDEPHKEEEPEAKEEDKKGESATTATEGDKPAEIVIDDRPLDEIIKELDSLIGLESIKTKIRDYVDYLNFLQIREEKGFKEDDDLSLHAVFTGNPGTGKTTVVKLLGKIYHSIGLLSKGHVHTVEANDLISGFVRQTGDETKKAIEKARGGILFIDEAYMLFKEGGGSDFGPEAVAALITEMSDGKGDIAIMVAGYPKEMESFLDSNPGLKSRFRNYFHFEDYTPDELVEIAGFAAKKRDVTLSPGAKKMIKKMVTNAFRKRDRTFGNARFSHSLLDEAKMNLGIRLMNNYDPDQLTKSDLSTIMEEDIEDLSVNTDKKSLKLPVDNDLLKEALSELDQLTGLDSIKQEVQDMIKLAKYYREMGRDVLKVFSMHSIFTGNPGTGKTTVARIMGKFYKALGLLERGHLIDADGSDLVAGYVGQTSIKTMDLINEAQGGILFIDEAYAITEGYNSDFGKKAVATLVKQMEDKRKEFGLIVAGYPKNMENFLESNPGLKSRFDRTYKFEDFSEKNLYSIALQMFKERLLKPNKEASEHIKSYLSSLYVNRDKFFGNARSVRKMVEKAHRNQELRMASLAKSQRTKKVIATLIFEDVEEFNAVSREKSPGLGFRLGG